MLPDAVVVLPDAAAEHEADAHADGPAVGDPDAEPEREADAQAELGAAHTGTKAITI